MHGSVLHGFKEFVIQREGRDAWTEIRDASDAKGWYFATDAYEDDELYRLVLTTANRAGISVSALLAEFGEALVPTLMSLYGALLTPSWKTIDLLVNTETIIHRTVRIREPNADPPRLRAQRVSADEVHIVYTSERRLCALAIGFCRGVARHYGEAISIEQPSCMHNGDDACVLVVRLAQT